MKTYRVTFDHITPYALDIEAIDDDEALSKARDIFESLTPPQRVAAINCAPFLDYFDVEEA